MLVIGKKIFLRLLHIFYVHNHLRFYELPLPATLSQSNNTFAIKVVHSSEDISNIYFLSEKTKKKVIREIQRNSIVYIATDRQGYALHFSCVTDTRAFVLEIERDICIPENALYIFNCFTEEAARGRGIFPTVLQEICSLTSKDVALIAVLDTNQASIRAIEKADFLLKGTVIFNKVALKKSWQIDNELAYLFETARANGNASTGDN